MRFVMTGAVAAALFAVAAQADGPMTMDQPVTISGIETVCTGVADSKDDPRWSAYPIRVEFSNKAAQYLAGAHVTLAKADGAVLSQFDCPGSWVLFKLAPGRYKVTAVIGPEPGGTASASFAPPAKGQKRVVLRFSGLAANQ